MPWEYTDEYYRDYTRTTWNESAPHYDQFMAKLAPIRSDLVTVLAPRPGESVLDIGTGLGEPALSVAAAVGPSGRVTGVDLAEQMVVAARRLAAEKKMGNVEFLTMDSSALELPARSFDAVVSNFGFQIFTDPDKAAAEALRVLKPGGRIAVSIWGTGDRTPFLDVLIAPMLKHAEPDVNGYLPTPYETGGPGEMVRFLEGAGFRDAREERRSYMIPFDNADQYLDLILKATPIGHSLSEEEPAVQADVLAVTRANLERWRREDGLRLPAEAVLVTARAP
jgi:ubiquinone/menaquinone biosynthesis C-methylase UbiE